MSFQIMSFWQDEAEEEAVLEVFLQEEVLREVIAGRLEVEVTVLQVTEEEEVVAEHLFMLVVVEAVTMVITEEVAEGHFLAF